MSAPTDRLPDVRCLIYEIERLREVNAYNIALVAEVEKLRAAAITTLNNAWEDGAREERQHVTAWLREWASVGRIATRYDYANEIERGDHRREEAE